MICKTGKLMINKNILMFFWTIILTISLSSCSQKKIVDGAIGIITYSDNIGVGDSVNYYKKKTYVGTFKYDEKSPLSLKCMGVDEKSLFFKLENDTSVYYVRRSDSVAYKTWEEYILGSFSVSPLVKLNSIHLKPNNNSEVIEYDNDEFYYPVSIDGDWLEVEWGEESELKKGWIKWKEGEKLLIEIFAFA